MNAPREVVLSRAARDRALREAVRDDSKVRVSLNGIRRLGRSASGLRARQRWEDGAENVPRKVVISLKDRDRGLRAAVLDMSKVRVSLSGLRTTNSPESAGTSDTERLGR